ncbi:MAG: chloride channel protein [Actinomycetota bacterium]|nr:chloride channel protein [Actinomycetota bacterium]
MGAGEPFEGGSADQALGDFTIGWRTVKLLPLAVVVGALAAAVALGLLDLIGFITHLAYYGNVGTSLVAPTLHNLGVLTVGIPVVGGLLIGIMARYGSEQIRGHGIPEAMQTILTNGSRVQPRLAILKPISSAVSIGTGGPFGAEGPIIMTGGAVGSILAQLFHLAAIERRTLLVAGACAGMAAVFGTPVAAAIFGVELLVFEWRPRSFVPIAIAVAVADVLRNLFSAHHLIGAAPLFPVPAHGAFSAVGVGESAIIGVGAGVLALILTTACYGAEDLFKKLPIHWMWWPPIGGLVVGLGGLIDPKALGVGYGVIGAELAGKLAIASLALLLVVKLVIWSVALGSGTSGGILAPLLMMGAAMGGIIGHGFGGSSATWALMGMAGALSGVTRSPLTAIVFAFELTHDTGSLLPLLVVCTLAHLVSTLILKRSILTEKVARKGFHVMREYAVDQLEAVFVRQVMMTDLLTVEADEPASRLREKLDHDALARRQRLYPVITDGLLSAVVGWSDLSEGRERIDATVDDLAHHDILVAFPDETLRSAADRMAAHELTALPVVERTDRYHLVGVITYFELLGGRRRQLVEEHHRQRPLRLRFPWRTSPGSTVGWRRRSGAERVDAVEAETVKGRDHRAEVNGT